VSGWVADTGLFESRGCAGEPMTGCSITATNPAARPRARHFTPIQWGEWLQPHSQDAPVEACVHVANDKQKRGQRHLRQRAHHASGFGRV